MAQLFAVLTKWNRGPGCHVYEHHRHHDKSLSTNMNITETHEHREPRPKLYTLERSLHLQRVSSHSSTDTLSEPPYFDRCDSTLCMCTFLCARTWHRAPWSLLRTRSQFVPLEPWTLQLANRSTHTSNTPVHFLVAGETSNSVSIRISWQCCNNFVLILAQNLPI